ncbi:hypothetical protein [Escherichia coli ISC7]|uniref:Uncharacterized protein n=1 Tax=Escherichia coli ISC7 TaxID=1432555 RepID=W1F781_ECOLX|nr:hypothetical protein [Escherichia coli ISC7]
MKMKNGSGTENLFCENTRHKNVLNRVLMDSQGGKYESFTKFTPQCD